LPYQGNFYDSFNKSNSSKNNSFSLANGHPDDKAEFEISLKKLNDVVQPQAGCCARNSEHPRGRAPTQSYNHVDVYFMGFNHVVGLPTTGVHRSWLYKRDPCTRCSPFELNPCLEEDPSYQNLEKSRHHGSSQSPQTPGVSSPGRATPSPLLQNGQGDASHADVAKGPYRRFRCGLERRLEATCNQVLLMAPH
jgi:hypothetical protein